MTLIYTVLFCMDLVVTSVLDMTLRYIWEPILLPIICSEYIYIYTASVKVRNCGLGPHADQTDEIVRI